MGDDIVYAVFKELAILEGKRKPSGEWNSTDPKDISRILTRAYSIVRRAATPSTSE